MCLRRPESVMYTNNNARTNDVVACTVFLCLSSLYNSKYMLRVLYVNAESDGTCDKLLQQLQQQHTSTAVNDDSCSSIEQSSDHSKVLHDIEVPVTQNWPTAPRSLAIHPNGLQVGHLHMYSIHRYIHCVTRV